MRPLDILAPRRTPTPVRSRRRAVTRRSESLWRRPGLRAAVFGGLVTVLAGGAAWLWISETPAKVTRAVVAETHRLAVEAGFTVQQVTVSGRRETAAADILDALGVAQGDVIHAFDPEMARRKIEALGWVHTAKVGRLLPDTIRIWIRERRPFALWRDRRGLRLIDREGETITARNLARFAHLPVVRGAGARRAAADLIDILSAEPALYAGVREAVRVGGRRWDVRFRNGIDVRLPAAGALAAWRRLARLDAEHAILTRQIKVVDMRLPDRLIVRVGEQEARRRRRPGTET